MPHLAPRLGIDAVDAPIARRDVQGPAGVGRRSDDLVVGRERPAQQRALLAAKPVRVEMVVPRPEVEVLADDDGRRLDRACPHPPVLLTVARIPGDDEALRAALVLPAGKLVHVRLVDDPVVDRRRRGGAVGEVPRPDDLPRARVDREEAALLLRDVDLAVRDRGRELDVGASLELPEAVVRRPQSFPARGEVRALHVVAVRRPLLLEQPARAGALLAFLRLRLRLGGVGAESLRELLGRGAANVARAFLVPGPGPERGAEAEREQAHRQERPAQDADPAPQEGVGECEHDPGGEENLRSVCDRAFERCCERQDAGQVSDRPCGQEGEAVSPGRTCPVRRLPRV